MQRLLHLLFPTLVVMSLAVPLHANDCGSAINVATGANSGLQTFDTNCDLQGNTNNQRGGVATNCNGEVWFSWNPGMTNANVMNMDFQITTSGNAVVNIFLLYSESKDAGVSSCAWQSNFFGTFWGYTMYQFAAGQNMTTGVPFNFEVDGLDASGDYFIVVERVSGTGQVSFSPQLVSMLAAAGNDRCASPTVLGNGNGIDPNAYVGLNGGNWVNGADLSTANATKIRLSSYCGGFSQGAPSEDHYSKFAGTCIPTGNLGDFFTVPTPGANCVASLQNTTFYTFVAPSTASDFTINVSSANQCSQEPNQIYFMLFDPGFNCGDAEANISLLRSCQQVPVQGGLPVNDLTINNLTLVGGFTYWIAVDGTRGSQCDLKILITRGVVNPVLPVTLNYFRGEQRNGLNHLNWETSSEEQHDRFVVERSADGDFFERIGELSSEGEPNQAASYQFTDIQSPVGKSYYRLRMVDANGGSTYSQVIELQHLVEEFSFLGIVPNPASEQTDLLISSPTDIDARIILQDVRGRIIRSDSFQAEPGEHRVPMNISGLAPGLYLVQIQSGRRAFTGKLVVQ